MICTALHSQTTYSPYSNFGFGNLSDARNPVLKAMGKSGYAYRDHTVINSLNPASYTAFDTLSFLFEASAEINTLSLATTAHRERSTYGGLGHIQLGFPIWKYIKMSAGLAPISNVGYNVENKIIDTIVGNQTFKFMGKGGVNSVYGGLGFQLWDLSIGANVSYLFGNIDKSQALLFADSAHYLNTKRLAQIAVSAVMVDVGAQYYTKVADDLYLSIGAIYRPQLNLASKSSEVGYTYSISGSGSEVLKDTLFVKSNVDSIAQICFPQKIGGGFMLRKLNRYKIQANFDWTQWSKYEDITTGKGTLVNSISASVGFEYAPRRATSSTYWKWVRYRVGAYYAQDNFIVNDSKINQFGMTFGMGLPIARSFSMVNLTLDVGNRGTKANNLIQETYINFTLGFSLYDTWFYRIKYK